MARVADHLSVAELRVGYRGGGDATRARHHQVIWLLAQGRTVAETARLTSFAPRWIEALLARYNAFGPSSLGDRRRGQRGEGEGPDARGPRHAPGAAEDAARRRRGLDIEEGRSRHGGGARTGIGRRAARGAGAARDRLARRPWPRGPRGHPPRPPAALHPRAPAGRDAVDPSTSRSSIATSTPSPSSTPPSLVSASPSTPTATASRARRGSTGGQLASPRSDQPEAV